MKRWIKNIICYKWHASDYITIVVLSILFGALLFSANHELPYQWKWSVSLGYLFYQDDLGVWHVNILTQGVINTLRLFTFSIILGALLGLVLTFMRISKSKTLRILGTVYVNSVRNVPPLVFLFIFYFFISEQIFPKIGITPEVISNSTVLGIMFGDGVMGANLLSGAICLGLFESAFFAEILRGAISAIPKGQYDGGRALGLSWGQVMGFIILPQSLRKCYPSMAGQSIMALKNTSIASLISVKDLVFSGVEVVSSTHRIFETWIIVAVIYFVLCFGLTKFFAYWEDRIAKQY